MLAGSLFGSQSVRMERAFAAQFTPDGDGYLYRRGARGEAVRVTATERDAFVADYGRTWRRLYWSLLGGAFALVIALGGLSLALALASDSRAFSFLVYGSITALIGVTVALQMRAYYEPGRALAHRVPVAGPLSRAEYRRTALALKRWRQIVFAALFAAVLVAGNWPFGQPHSAGSLIRFAVGLVMLPLLGWTAIGKWRAGRNR